MSNRLALVCVFFLMVAACGDDDGAGGTTTGDTRPAPTTGATGTGNGGGGSGDVVNRQAPGTAAVSVDGQAITFETVGPVGCSVTGDEIMVGFLFGDNEASFIAGATASGSEWRGRIDVNLQGSDGITTYFADFAAGDGGTIAVDGSSFSYSGEWQVFQPGVAEAQPAGQGTLSATCG